MTTGYTMRFYQDEADYAQMRDLLRATYALTVPPLNCTIGDLDWRRSITNDPELMRKVQLWFDPLGLLVAFVWPGKTQIDVMIRPNHRILEQDILERAEVEYRQALASDATNRAFLYFSYTDDVVRNTLLMERGYVRTDNYYPFHAQPLNHMPGVPTLPAGYTIRHVLDEADLPARVAVHRAAFHPSRMTVEKHRQVMASPTYRPELDLIAVAPDGTFAAYTIVWLDEFNRMGIFEPVGCHPDHQRRGLAGAVMIEGMRRLYQLGATTAHVGAWREDSAGAGLYRSLGFEVMGREYGWEKQL
ncbi:MAG: GNAT family N-acetyltransferase [Chloroflexi bacterium]|nr:GNAT family N-acetyltransferase [Chloroflexota bacterium]